MLEAVIYLNTQLKNKLKLLVIEKMKAQFDPTLTDVLKNFGIAVLVQFIMSLIFAAIFKKQQPVFTSTEE